MKFSRVLILALSGFIFINSSNGYTQDNSLVRYNSASLSVNLNRALETSKIIYHLSKEPAFSEKLFYAQLDKIEQSISSANNDIADIIFNSNKNKKTEIRKYLKRIDEHLAQVSVDIKQINEDLKEKHNISRFISDMYYQIKRAETEDHAELIRIQHFTAFDEPLQMN